MQSTHCISRRRTSATHDFNILGVFDATLKIDHRQTCLFPFVKKKTAGFPTVFFKIPRSSRGMTIIVTPNLGSDGCKPSKCSSGAFLASLRAAMRRRSPPLRPRFYLLHFVFQFLVKSSYLDIICFEIGKKNTVYKI